MNKAYDASAAIRPPLPHGAPLRARGAHVSDATSLGTGSGRLSSEKDGAASGCGSVTSTDTNPTHKYAAKGTYSVTETVTDSGDLRSSKTVSVAVARR